MILHKHHIIPKHRGGTDAKENILKVNISLHAFLHKLLWEEYGCWQDEIAWKALSGQITNSEAIKISQINSGKSLKFSKETRLKLSLAKLGKKQSPETIAKRTKKLKGQKRKPRSQEWKDKISKSKKGQVPWIKGKNHSAESKEKNKISHLGKKHTQETKQKISNTMRFRLVL